MHTSWKEYFIFTKKERVGIIILLTLILICTVLPFYCPGPQNPTDQNALAQLQKQSLDKDSRIDSDKLANRQLNKEEPFISKPVASHKLFRFNPNTLSEAGWQQLPVKEKTIQTILHYLSKGGQFKRPEDLAKIYGLRPDEYTMLLPYLDIPRPLENRFMAAKKESSGNKVEFHPKSISYISSPIDINTPDTALWISLPGIGYGLARRIMNFRDKLGGFYSIDQVAETFGLSDSTFQLIKNRLLCPSPGLKMININAAGVEILRQHPYIRWKLANIIVLYRQQHGPFGSIQELTKINVISPELFQKIAPYLALE